MNHQYLATGELPLTVSVEDFEKLDVRTGVVERAEAFPEARKPAYRLWVDFGPEMGTKKSSAQITDRYEPQDLVGRHVVAVTNFPPLQIGPFTSEVLVLGALADDGVVLLEPEAEVPAGTPVA